MKIISGGQTGVDRAALDVAIERGMDWGGWCPKGGWAEDLPDPPGLLPKYPHLKGSWSPAGDAHASTGGRVMSTSLAILTLEVYYRHLPLYRRDLGGTKTAAK